MNDIKKVKALNESTNDTNFSSHIPVLLEETMDLLNIKPGGIYVDCTLGAGGHSAAILRKLNSDNGNKDSKKIGHLYCFEQDKQIIEEAETRLKKIGTNYTIINDNFMNIALDLKKYQVSKVDGILYDLGVSSLQIDSKERGFSYLQDGPLDMRMNQEQSLSAYDVVNNYSAKDLTDILYNYGEESYAKNIVKKIIENRPIASTLELVNVIKKALPAAVLRKDKHPAKKTFQAIRIEVNKELSVFSKSLEDAVTLLNPKGRVAVITFHSLEDRLCKHFFKKLTTLDLPSDLPFIPQGYEIDYELITRKSVQPSDNEQKNNSRSHSARLRVIEKK